MCCYKRKCLVFSYSQKQNLWVMWTRREMQYILTVYSFDWRPKSLSSQPSPPFLLPMSLAATLATRLRWIEDDVMHKVTRRPVLTGTDPLQNVPPDITSFCLSEVQRPVFEGACIVSKAVPNGWNKIETISTQHEIYRHNFRKMSILYR